MISMDPRSLKLTVSSLENALDQAKKQLSEVVQSGLKGVGEGDERSDDLIRTLDSLGEYLDIDVVESRLQMLKEARDLAHTFEGLCKRLDNQISDFPNGNWKLSVSNLADMKNELERLNDLHGLELKNNFDDSLIAFEEDFRSAVSLALGEAFEVAEGALAIRSVVRGGFVHKPHDLLEVAVYLKAEDKPLTVLASTLKDLIRASLDQGSIVIAQEVEGISFNLAKLTEADIEKDTLESGLLAIEAVLNHAAGAKPDLEQVFWSYAESQGIIATLLEGLSSAPDHDLNRSLELLKVKLQSMGYPNAGNLGLTHEAQRKGQFILLEAQVLEKVRTSMLKEQETVANLEGLPWGASVESLPVSEASRNLVQTLHELLANLPVPEDALEDGIARIKLCRCAILLFKALRKEILSEVWLNDSKFIRQSLRQLESEIPVPARLKPYLHFADLIPAI